MSGPLPLWGPSDNPKEPDRQPTSRPARDMKTDSLAKVSFDRSGPRTLIWMTDFWMTDSRRKALVPSCRWASRIARRRPRPRNRPDVCRTPGSRSCGNGKWRGDWFHGLPAGSPGTCGPSPDLRRRREAARRYRVRPCAARLRPSRGAPTSTQPERARSPFRQNAHQPRQQGPRRSARGGGDEGCGARADRWQTPDAQAPTGHPSHGARRAGRGHRNADYGRGPEAFQNPDIGFRTEGHKPTGKFSRFRSRRLQHWRRYGRMPGLQA